MHCSFAKYHGLGNDFILIDDRGEAFPLDDTALIAKLCQRRTGIGADGLILLQNSFRADYWMRIFNSDGKETQMCGNGLRCFMAFLRDLNLALTRNQILVEGELYTCSFEENQIAVQMGKAKEVSWNVSLPLEGKEVVAHYIHLCVPHVVIFVDDMRAINVEKEGKEIRWHPMFQPQGVNVNFVSEHSSGFFEMITFERGVEGVTPACGTGAAAVGIALSKMQGCTSPMKIMAASQEMLEIRLCDEDEVEMIGGARFVFKGQFSQKGLKCITV